MHTLFAASIACIFAFAGSLLRAAEPMAESPPATVRAVRIVLVGDSTMCDYASDRPDRGWGQFVAERFRPGSVEVFNHAKPGRSTKTFIKEGRWTRALADRPDFVFVQFGHNDSHAPEKPESTDAATDYRDYLRRYVDESRAAGATPILVTPMVRRTFRPDGTLEDILAPYADAMKAVASERKVTLIDLHASSRALVEPMGPDAAQIFANKKSDLTHFNEKGARAMAALVFKALPAAEPRLAALLAEESPAPPASAPSPAPAQAPLAKLPETRAKLHLYLLLGQSNMAGRDTREMDALGTTPRVMALDYSDSPTWRIARDPLHDKTSKSAPGVGPGIAFAREMLKHEPDPDVVIGLVPCAVGGTPLDRWVKGADLYEKALARARAASVHGEIKGVLWHQGENDARAPAIPETYGDRLTVMFADLRRDLEAPSLPIVVGQLGSFVTANRFAYRDQIRAALSSMPTRVLHVGFADSEGLRHMGDSLHFSTEAQREFGTRYAAVMLQLRKAIP